MHGVSGADSAPLIAVLEKKLSYNSVLKLVAKILAFTFRKAVEHEIII